MKEIVLINEDGSSKKIQVEQVSRYRSNLASYYIAEGQDGLYLLMDFGGTLYHIPGKYLDKKVKKTNNMSSDLLPDLILPLLVVDNPNEISTSYEQLQPIASEVEAQGHWFSNPQVPTGIKVTEGEPQEIQKNVPVHKHNIYATYLFEKTDYYGEFLKKQEKPLSKGSTIYSLFTSNANPNEECAMFFTKPYTFKEIPEAIDKIVQENKTPRFSREIPNYTLEMGVEAGTTISDYVILPNGKVKLVLALAQPGIHRYNVTFGKCSNKKIYKKMQDFDEREVIVTEQEYNNLGNEYAFRAGLTGILPVVMSDVRYLPNTEYENWMMNFSGTYYFDKDISEDATKQGKKFL